MNKKYYSPKDYQDAAKAESTTVSELAELANSEYNFVRLAVAVNLNVTPEVLDSLVPANLEDWNEQEIAAAITANAKTSPATLEKLAEKLTPFLNCARNNDMASRAGVNLFSHPNAPLNALQKILSAEKVSVIFRRKIARQTNRTDVLELLLKDRSEAVRKRASKNSELNFESSTKAL